MQRKDKADNYSAAFWQYQSQEEYISPKGK
jgi:hypothetical protein